MSEITADDLRFNFVGHSVTVRHLKSGIRIGIDVPEDQLADIIYLPFLNVGDQLVKVTIEPHQEESPQEPASQPPIYMGKPAEETL